MVLLAFILILCAFTMPPQITFAVFMFAALARIIYLTRDASIDAAAEVITSPIRLASDLRRNGISVLRVIFCWAAAIGVWLAIITYFKIPF